MDGTLGYTRSLRRRFFAYMIDLVVAGLLTSLVMLPFAAGPDSRLRLSDGLLKVTTCEPQPVTVFDAAGIPLSTSGWSSVSVCTTVSDLFFQDRRAVFLNQWTEGSTTYSQQMEFPVDSANRIVTPLYMDWLNCVVLIVLAAIMESSARATPGKRLLGLAVVRRTGEKAGLAATALRNVLKNGPWLVISAYELAANLLPYLVQPLAEAANGKVNLNVGQLLASGYLEWALMAFVVLAVLIILGTLLFPWKKAGRSIYDRLAGTMVIRILPA